MIYYACSGMVAFCRLLLILLLNTALLVGGFTQTTAIFNNPELDYRLGLELFAKEKFGAAQPYFESVINQVDDPVSPLRISASYYDALCALELYNSNAEYKLAQFSENYPGSSYQNLVNFQLGKLTYGNRKFRKALEYFSQVDVKELSTEERAECYFKMGYCYFRQEDYARSRQSFESVMTSSSKYTSPAFYYLAHLDYTERKLDKALENFKKLEQDPHFGSIAPYYIVQIQYLKKNYTEVLSLAPPLLINATEKRAAELTKIMGESYYYLERYDKALPYLEQYYSHTRHAVTRDDHYKLGFTYYMEANYEAALDHLQRAAGPDDTLSQFAYYYIGASYLKTGKKQFASNAFNSAYKLPYDRQITEDALFNMAQLAFELSYDPYSEAVKSLRAYLKEYPGSERADEAYNFLFKIAMATRNFKDARESLENITVKGSEYQENLQKISYYYGIELFNKFSYEEAINLFKTAADLKKDPQITAESLFWIAESYYRIENYGGSRKYYMDFLAYAGSRKTSVFNLANYNLGYVNFKRKDYAGAITYFQEFVKMPKNEEPVLIADAYLRLGDSWFISKKYDDAISAYDAAIKMKAIDVDYALLQKSKALGVLLRYPEQIATLKQITTNHPGSTYISEAYYEMAASYLINRDPENALFYFRKVATDYPSSGFALKGRLKAGLIYYNSGLNDLAIKTFKEIVSDYPATIESKEALTSIRNIYVEMGRVDEFFNYAGDLPFANISVSEQDSLSFTSAENQYMKGQFSNASASLLQYLTRFPQGAYRLPASYYLAECLFKENYHQEALDYYEQVIEMPVSEFTENALLKAANLSFILEDYPKALNYFNHLGRIAQGKENILESWYGQMKTNYILAEYENAIEPAKKILEEPKISEKMKLETMMIHANSLLRTNDLVQARRQYEAITGFSQGAAGAEAKYRIVEIDFRQRNYTSAEKEVFELINKYAAYDYWVASGFIQLADIYLINGNTFQAKQTLQSIIDNYEGDDDIKPLALQKLHAINTNE
jgi:TolA-binding protein